MMISIEPLVAQLRTQLRASGFDNQIFVHEGPALKASKSEKAGTLRDSGASWGWVALGIESMDFWDTHIGMIPDSSVDGYYTVGLHWTERDDAMIRPLATAIIGSGKPVFSQPAKEFQWSLSPLQTTGSLPTPEAATAAIELAIQFLSVSSTQNKHHQKGK